jgi:hypothetical protein
LVPGCGLKFRGILALVKGLAEFELFPRIGFWFFRTQNGMFFASESEPTLITKMHPH